MMDKHKPKRRIEFVCEVRSEESFRERLRMYEFDEQFGKAILHAYRGQTGPLRDLLHSDTPLSAKHCEMLAILIKRRIEPKRRGRPRGSLPVPNLAWENERALVDRVRQSKLRMLGSTRAPRGALNTLIDQEMQQMNDDNLLEGGASKERVRSELKRGARQTSPTAPRR
jgi:hypothetical protein